MVITQNCHCYCSINIRKPFRIFNKRNHCLKDFSITNNIELWVSKKINSHKGLSSKFSAKNMRELTKETLMHQMKLGTVQHVFKQNDYK